MRQLEDDSPKIRISSRDFKLRIEKAIAIESHGINIWKMLFCCQVEKLIFFMHRVSLNSFHPNPKY